MQKKGIVIISSVVVGSTLVILLINKLLKDKAERDKLNASKNPSINPDVTVEIGTPDATEIGAIDKIPSNDSFPLSVSTSGGKAASYGKQVVKLQAALKYLGENVTVDGKYGISTVAAVRNVANKNGLSLSCTSVNWINPADLWGVITQNVGSSVNNCELSQKEFSWIIGIAMKKAGDTASQIKAGGSQKFWNTIMFDNKAIKTLYYKYK
jgi:peptidoglycan hydrolase-like protein with peptidoglycan-binding domain